MKYNSPYLAAIALAGLIGLGGCATPSGGATAADKSAAADNAAATEVESWDGNGMNIPLDGRSMAHFDAYMARVKKYSSEEDYITLKNAIDYLLFYDITAEKDMNKLIQNLDGLTGYEILTKVGWRKPVQNKSKSAEATAKASLIDT